jgi:DNA-binding FadR family transcriptional regulator
MSTADARDAAQRSRIILFDQRAAVDRGDALRAAECDASFHRMLCSYTGNAVLRTLADGLIESSRHETLAVYSLQEDGSRSLEQHHKIVDALVAGRLDHAATLISAHMIDVARRYNEEKLASGRVSPLPWQAPDGDGASRSEQLRTTPMEPDTSPSASSGFGSIEAS